jgi:hypothetical protein
LLKERWCGDCALMPHQDASLDRRAKLHLGNGLNFRPSHVQSDVILTSTAAHQPQDPSLRSGESESIANQMKGGPMPADRACAFCWLTHKSGGLACTSSELHSPIRLPSPNSAWAFMKAAPSLAGVRLWSSHWASRGPWLKTGVTWTTRLHRNPQRLVVPRSGRGARSRRGRGQMADCILLPFLILR